MDIHKQKPWRGLPEFLKEIGTIVIGVLIALGAEQAAEALHQRHEVGDARETLRQEVQGDVQNALYSQREDTCLLALLDRLAAWARGGPRPKLNFAILPNMVDTGWETARGGAVAHMSQRERMAFATFYAEAANVQSLTTEQRRMAFDFKRYEPLDSLTPAEARGLLQEVGAGRAVLGSKLLNAPILVQLAGRVGVEPQPLPAAVEPQLAATCRAETVD